MKLPCVLLLTVLLAGLAKVESNSKTVDFQSLLDKMSNTDQDYRYMALKDLMAEFQKENFRLDDQFEKKLVDKVLQLLGDAIGEVQTEAVRCLGQMIKLVKPSQITLIVDTLCANMMSEDPKVKQELREQLKELSSGALKTAVAQLPPSLAPSVAGRVAGKLIALVDNAATSQQVAVESLTILSDLLSRFSESMIPVHEAIVKSLLPQLSSQKPAIRARAIDVLSNLVVSCNSNIYDKVIKHLVDELEGEANQAQIRTNVQCLASVWRQAGHRLCSYIDRVIVLVEKFSEQDDDDLREYCNQVYEAFVKQCPEATKPHIQSILDSSLSNIKHDPNYIDDDESDSESESDGEGSDNDDDDDDDDDDDFGDDDDMSWKVRYSAAKILEAIISTRPDLIEDLYKTVSPALIARFKEREEKVKSDIFSAYIALLRITQSDSSAVEALKKQIPDIVKNVQLVLRGKSLKSRQSCYALLRQLVNVVPGTLDDGFKQLVAGIQSSLTDTDSNLKIDALSFLANTLTTHDATVLRPHVPTLAPQIVELVTNPSYKVAARALNILPALFSIIRSTDAELDKELKPFVGKIYESALSNLQSQKTDREAKEKLTICLAQIIAHFGDALDKEPCLPLFLESVKNDATRLTAIEALSIIAASPLNVNLTPILAQTVELAGSFLEKGGRTLKPALSLLDALVSHYNSYIDTALLKKAIANVPQLLDNSDPEIVQKTLVLVTSIASVKGEALNGIHESIVAKLPALVQLPLLQDNTNVRLIEALAVAKLPGLGFRQLLDSLRSLAVDEELNLDEKAMQSIARSAAAMTIPLQSEAIPLANELLADIKQNRGDRKTVFSLLTIGEIGRHFKLSTIDGLSQSLIAAFGSTSEEVKSAASRALGAVAVGDASKYLSQILSEIDSQQTHQYLVLDSLYEFISSLTKSSSGLQQLQSLIPSIWRQLINNCESSESKVRNTITKCIAQLVLVKPDEFYPSLQQELIKGAPLKKTVLLSAIGFIITNQPQPIDNLLRQSIGQLLENAITDAESTVRHAAVVVLDSVINKKPSLVKESLPSLMSHVYAEAKIKPELVTIVEMGPIKHRVDNGTENRRAAYNCMQLLLNRGLDVIDVTEFLVNVQAGMNDVETDIQKQAFFLTTRLAALYPNEMATKLDIFIEPLKVLCQSKAGEKEEDNEPVKFKNRIIMKRLALQTLSHIRASVPNADKNAKVAEFLKIIQASPELRKFLQEVKNESWDA